MSTNSPIESGKIYHLYNHSNGSLQLFRADDNYRYFLSKYTHYVHPFVDTYAYCLMPNHFHFAIKVKDESSEVSKTSELYHKEVTNAIKNWLISYTQAYHKVYLTRGNLYYQKIRRKVITDKDDLLNLIGYIHLNPVHHKFVNRPEEWKYSSYTAFISDKETLIKRSEVLMYFDDKENFQFYHHLNTEKLMIEMELSY